MKVDGLIPKLKRDRHLYGTCPHCGDEFRLGSAHLFSLKGDFPEQALARISAMKADLKEQREVLRDMKHRMTTRSQVTAESVNLGKILEKIAPSFNGFHFATRDCRSLLEPVDYLIFSGLHQKGEVESVTFLDVKSGSARLTKSQKAIAGLVERGRVEVDVIKQPKGASE
jgi:predicted Holliday junction resolvase-like endonuclease